MVSCAVEKVTKTAAPSVREEVHFMLSRTRWNERTDSDVQTSADYMPVYWFMSLW